MENSIILLTILVIIFGVVALLLPFFVLKIRNQTVSMNRKLARIIEILDNTNTKPAPTEIAGEKNKSDNLVTCEICQSQVPIKDFISHVSSCKQKK